MSPVVQLAIIAALLGFSAWIGGWPEKAGAAALALNIAATQLTQLVVGADPIPFLIYDGLLGLSFFVLCFLSQRLWAGIAGCAVHLLVTLSLVRPLGFPMTTHEYLDVLVASSVTVLLAIVLGALAARWGHLLKAGRRRTMGAHA